MYHSHGDNEKDQPSGYVKPRLGNLVELFPKSYVCMYAKYWKTITPLRIKDWIVTFV